MDQDMTFRVRERAYHIWAARGGRASRAGGRARGPLLSLGLVALIAFSPLVSLFTLDALHTSLAGRPDRP